MAALLQLFLNRGTHAGERSLSTEAIARMETPHTTLAAQVGLTYGYGLAIEQELHHGTLFFGHVGDADGHLARFGYSPALDRGYFIGINAFNQDALAKIRRAVGDFLRESATVPAPPPRAELSPAERLALIGHYTRVTNRYPPSASTPAATIEIFENDGRLYTRASANTAPRELVPVGPLLFRRGDQPLATMAFIPVGTEIFLQGDFGNYRRTPPAPQSQNDR